LFLRVWWSPLSCLLSFFASLRKIASTVAALLIGCRILHAALFPSSFLADAFVYVYVGGGRKVPRAIGVWRAGVDAGGRQLHCTMNKASLLSLSISIIDVDSRRQNPLGNILSTSLVGVDQTTTRRWEQFTRWSWSRLVDEAGHD
jgi:hypothetical protein